MSKAIMPWDEAIIKVLKDRKKAMHYRRITDAIIEDNLRPNDKLGATPSISVNSYLRGDKLKDLVVRVGRGEYILKEYLSDKMIVQQEQNDDSQIDGEVDDNEMDDALITAYGRFWKRETFVQSECNLFGANFQTPKASVVDFTNHPGVYILHMGYTPIYVGQATKLYERLAAHTKDNKRNKWDSFSWFSIKSFENHDIENDSKKTKSIFDNSLLDTLEALLIEVLGPEKNKKSGNEFEDKEFEQIDKATYLERKYVKTK